MFTRLNLFDLVYLIGNILGLDFVDFLFESLDITFGKQPPSLAIAEPYVSEKSLPDPPKESIAAGTSHLTGLGSPVISLTINRYRHINSLRNRLYGLNIFKYFEGFKAITSLG